MSNLLCVPFRPGWQVGISERRNGFTKNIASCDFFLAGLRRLVLRFASCEAVLGEPRIGEGGGDEEDVRLVVRTTPPRVASRNLRATEPLPSSAAQRYSARGVN